MSRGPCYNCQRREEACHDRCYAYKDFKKKIDNVTRNRRKSHLTDHIMVQSVERTTGRKAGQI